MKRMILLSQGFYCKGHTEEYVRNLYKHLSNDFELLLVTGENLDKNEEFIETLNLDVDFSSTDAKKFTKYGPLGRYFRALNAQKKSIKFYRSFLNNVELNSDDVVFIMDYSALPLKFLLKKLNKKRIQTLLYIHSARFDSRDLIYKLYKKILRGILVKFLKNKKNNIIITDGKYIQEQLQNEFISFRDQVELIQYPSEIQIDQLEKSKARDLAGFKKEEKLVLFFGLLREDKNIDFLIEVFSKLKNENIKLIIAGAEASVTREMVLNWMNQYSVSNIKLDIKYLSEEEMATYYSSADLLILTYDIESASQSGPLSLARNFKLPALVSNAGELGDYVIENRVGFVADPTSVGDFASNVREFFSMEEDERDKLYANIDAAKEKFSWKSAANEYKKIIG